MNSSLNDKQEMFCREYLIDFNATQAAIRAGYSKNTARQLGARLLSNVDVQRRLQELIAERADRVEITADTVLKNLYEIATLDIADVLNDDGSIKNISEWSEAWRKAVGGIDVIEQSSFGEGESVVTLNFIKKIKGIDKLKAWELLGKHIDVSAFKERLELSGKDGKELIINVTSPDTKDKLQKLQENLQKE